MRKITIKVTPNKGYMKMYKPFSKYFEEISLVQLLKLDLKQNSETVIVEIKLRKGLDIKRIELPDSVELFEVLSEKYDTYICLAKVNYSDKKMNFFKLGDIDGIWDVPSITTEKYIIRSLIATEKNIKKFIDEMQKIGKVERISFKSAIFTKYDLLSELTKKQKTILTIAKENGYFKEPREINGTQLAKRFGCSKVTMNEHLTRIKNKLINKLLEE